MKYWLIILLFLVSACNRRNLVYFSNLEEEENFITNINNVVEPKIQPDDLLKITVSSLNPESNILFNSGVIHTASGGNNPGAVNLLNEGYLVDKNGLVNFPVLGKVHLVGLTKDEAIEKMTSEIRNYVKDPIINIRFLNFKVTVIGEVNRPSSFTINSERINILEALGLAGDMTPFGRRENVMLIREKEGVRTATRLNLNDKDVLNSPYFYLQQNDVVYVQPHNQTRVAPINPAFRYLPILTAALLLFGRIYRFL